MTEKDFRILEDYVLPPKAPPPTEDFYKYVKPSRDEIDAKLEYDMDEEDFAWLELFNEQRSKVNLSHISFDTFEYLMDLFEKECFFHCTSKNFKPVPPELEHQADCAICLDGASNEDNAILFCDMCSLSVHQKCYGVIKVPEEIWLCKRCLYSPAATTNCCLCSCKSGALKKSLDGKWAHIVCAFWIPEVNFGGDRAREPIMGIEAVSSIRWKLTCFVCNQKGKGACLQCQHSNCSTAYHASCAQLVGLTMKMETFIDTDGVSKKKVTSFCEIHSIQLADDSFHNNDLREYEGPKYPSSDDSEDGTLQTSRTSNSVSQDSSKSRKNVSWKSRLKLARKILAAWIEMEQPIFVPVVTVAIINKIIKKARELDIEKHESFVTRLHSYWTLKRQSRDGCPLLNSRKFGENIKILNVNVHLSPGCSHHQSLNLKSFDSTTTLPVSSNLFSPSSVFLTSRSIDMESQSRANVDKMITEENETCTNSNSNDEDGDDDIDDNDESFALHLKFCQRLRQDLEKVRLLIELVRKREKLKLEQIKLYEKQMTLQLCPDYSDIKLILDEIVQSTRKIFDNFKDGAKFLESLQTNLEDRIYFSLEDFLSDLKHLFALCPQNLVKEMNEKISSISLTIPKRTTDDSIPRFQGTCPLSYIKPIFIQMSDMGNKIIEKPFLQSPSSSMLNDDYTIKSKAKKRKSDAADYIQETSKMKLMIRSKLSHGDMSSKNDCYQTKRSKYAPIRNKSCKGSSFNNQTAESLPKERESFKTYRLKSSPKTDDDNEDQNGRITESKKIGLSSSEGGSCYDDNDGEETSGTDEDDGTTQEFKSFDLVWAKYRSFPWYPAMVIPLNSPPPPPYLSIQLPIIPQETMDILSIKPMLKLVLFFDDESTWRCIPINKLLPLGTNPAIDKWKLLDTKKMGTRKAIQAAYDKALQYQQATLDTNVKDHENGQRHQGKKIKHIQLSIALLEERNQYQLQMQQLQQQLSQQIISESNFKNPLLEMSSKSPSK